MIELRVAGRPAPQGSLNRGRGGALYHASPNLASWRALVAAAASAQAPAGGPIRGPLSLDITFEILRPLAHYRGRSRDGHIALGSILAYPRRPDLSKLIRATEDALVIGGLIADDAQVIALSARKVYARAGGARIQLVALDQLPLEVRARA